MTTTNGAERRVVITGVGAISCLGGGAGAFWRGLCTGGGAPEPLRDPDAHMRNRLMYLVPRADVPAHPVRFADTSLGEGPRMAVAAAREAVTDAGLDPDTRSRLPVVMGVEMGNAGAHESRRAAARHGDHGAGAERRWSPLALTSAAVGAALGSTGANHSVGNACAASGYAVALAADLIRSGEADVVLTGGAEGPTRVGMGAFNRLGALDPVRCRPFDRDRAGTVFGAGAALLVLESAERAARRGAAPYAELRSAAFSCDAYHATAPEPSGAQAVRSIRQALDDAGLTAEDIGAVIPHGTGTTLNDVVESVVLRQVFGDRCARLPLFSLKGMIGHTAGVAGAFGVLTAALLLRHHRIPPNAPLDDQDPECAVWLPQRECELPSDRAVLVNAYAFGGNNVSAVLSTARGPM